MAQRSQGACCGCIFGIIAIIVVLALIAGFVLSKLYTIEQVGLADTPGILANFDAKYSQEDTFRTQNMQNWKVWDILVWIVKSGNHEPKEAEPFKLF